MPLKSHSAVTVVVSVSAPEGIHFPVADLEIAKVVSIFES